MKKTTLVMTIILCTLALFTACGGSADTYTAGTYTATEQGYVGDVTVEVKFDRDSILSVNVTDQNETVGFGDKAIDAIPGEIVEAQTWEVDAVTSATVTSDALKAAVKDCIEQAENK